MTPNIVILSLFGTLMVILNKPIGTALYRARLGMGDRDIDVWAYRGPVIIIGVLLACLSFAVYD